MKTINSNKKTNRQANVKTFFQRLMILMATIMVSTALVGCDGLNGDDPDNGGTPTGKIDQKLIGSWEYQSTATHAYYFNANGTFTYSYMSSSPHSTTGNYTTSDGKVTFTNNVSLNAYGVRREFPDTVVAEYKIAKADNGKEYLHIAHLNYNPSITYFPATYQNMWYKKF